ncbi:MAG TPA: MBL fold metallo-hydrolase, partial [Chloroflexi bacterium]|nr:MBL fold metallo-hydrolase [Chloroflexota bacterium]
MADSWFTVTPLGHGITAIAEPLREGADVKSYLIEGQREAAIVDTGAGVGDFKGLVEQLTSLPLVDVQT